MTDDPSLAPLAQSDAAPAGRQRRPTAAPWSGRESERASRAATLEAVAALRLAMRGRFVSLAVVGVLLFTVAPLPDVLWFHGLLVVFGFLGWLQYRLHRDAGTWTGGHTFVDNSLIAADFALLTFTILYPNPLSVAAAQAPIQLFLNGSNVIYFFIILGSLVLSATPRRVMVGGALAAAAWSTGFLIIALRPDSVTILNTDVPARIGVYDDAARAILTDPRWVDIMMLPQQVVVIVLVAWILSIAVGRSRRLLVRQAEAARQRANLARYFPPTVADRLARREGGLGAVSVQPVAVLFADVVGFTALSEREPPERVVDMLRELHRRLADAVFAHDGTLDKFLGDGVMATFGTPDARDDDAARALACGRAMLDAVADWNRQRAGRGEAPVRLSVGLHCGPAVLGDIGSERRLELAVVGDVVNVAARLEATTRGHDTALLASDALVSTAVDCAGERARRDLEPVGPLALDGRADGVAAWKLVAGEERAAA